MPLAALYASLERAGQVIPSHCCSVRFSEWMVSEKCDDMANEMFYALE